MRYARVVAVTNAATATKATTTSAIPASTRARSDNPRTGQVALTGSRSV